MIGGNGVKIKDSQATWAKLFTIWAGWIIFFVKGLNCLKLG
jgi:hypothetical protein